MIETVSEYAPPHLLAPIRPVERARCRITPGRDGLVDVDVLGSLSPAWLLDFSAGLYPLGVSLKEAYAREDRPGRWSARLHLEPPSEAAASRTMSSLDALLHDDFAVPSVPPPRLLDFTLSGEASPAGVAHLEVHAWESRGLLAGVLVEAAAHGLRPIELLLETEGDCAFHHVALRAGARAPSRGALRGLQRGLRRFVGG